MIQFYYMQGEHVREGDRPRLREEQILQVEEWRPRLGDEWHFMHVEEDEGQDMHKGSLQG